MHATLPSPEEIDKPAPDADKKAIRENLEKTITRIEKKQILLEGAAAPLRVSLGIEKIDAILDPKNHQGLIASALHEIRVETGRSAANGAGFALCLGLTIARQLRCQKNAMAAEPKDIPPVFWVCERHIHNEYAAFYTPGLAAFGLAPENLIRIHPRSREETLWAAGEIAATNNAAAFCLIEIKGHPKEFDLTATRRLMLRAQTSQTPVLLLRQSGHEEASAAATRWHVSPAISSTAMDNCPSNPLLRQFLGPPVFSVSLEKCRGAIARQTSPWIMEWNTHEQCLTLLEPDKSRSNAAITSHNAA
jgi:protein ImuA